jgi:hypothetical protein
MKQQTQDPKAAYSALDKKFSAIFGKTAHDYVQNMGFVDKHHVQHTQELDTLLTAQKSELQAILEGVERTGGFGVTRPMHVSPTPGVAQAQAAVPEYITAEAFWWGFHVEIPEAPLKTLMTVGSVLKAIGGVGTAGTSGVMLIAGASTPPGVVIIAGIAAAFAVETAAINIADHGKGVYLSWTWLQVPMMATLVGAASALALPTAR